MTTSPAQDFLKPRLLALVCEAEKAGLATDVTVAVLMDLLDTLYFGPDIDAESEGEDR